MKAWSQFIACLVCKENQLLYYARIHGSSMKKNLETTKLLANQNSEVFCKHQGDSSLSHHLQKLFCLHALAHVFWISLILYVSYRFIHYFHFQWGFFPLQIYYLLVQILKFMLLSFFTERKRKLPIATLLSFWKNFLPWKRFEASIQILQEIVHDIDKTCKGCTIAKITVGSAGIFAGVLTIAGVALASVFDQGVAVDKIDNLSTLPEQLNNYH